MVCPFSCCGCPSVAAAMSFTSAGAAGLRLGLVVRKLSADVVGFHHPEGDLQSTTKVRYPHWLIAAL
jgi:hypothetical protein